ncbi:lipopolysaccharide biosynthesis protein [Terrisporobacter vanillatitrophus]|uniref:lipopolysaccharide biosynthesis protein n=1 Tax=Terrisporobacter vanillatitrophus TaxID=3058402 RepID=UPI0033665FCB
MKRNELKLGAILSYLSLFLGTFIQILYTPIMIRLLGQAEYGLFTLANSVIGYLGVLEFGIGNAIVRYTAKYRANNDKEGEYNLNGMLIIVYSFIAIVVAIAGSLLVSNSNKLFSNALSVSELNTIKILMSLMIFNMVIAFPFGIFNSIVSAYERFTFQKILGIIRTILNPLVMLPLLFMGYKSIGMTVISTALNIIFIIVNVYYCFKVLKVKIRFNNMEFSLFKEIFTYSFFIFLNMIVDRIYWGTDQLILGAVSGATMVAIYSIGSQFNNYYMTFSTAISSIFLPRVTQMVTKNVSDKELSDLFIKIGRIQYLVLSFILSGFILVGKEFIQIWAGEGYNTSYYIALVVMIPLTIPLIQNLGITILQAKNMHKFRSNLYVVIALMNVIMSIPLAYKLGGFGCALASGVCFFIGNGLIINIYYYKKINIDIPDFWKNIGRMTIPVLISLLCSNFINLFIPGYTLSIIIAKGLIFTMIFISLMWLMGMNEYEKNLMRSSFKKIYLKLNIVRG